MPITKQKITLIALVVIVVIAIVGFALSWSTSHGPTYIRLVDTTDQARDNSPAPGADINAVEIVTSAKQKSFFAEKVISSHLLPGSDTQRNEYQDASTILGNPEAANEQQYVSLGGSGGEIVVQLNTTLTSGDIIRIYEIGPGTGTRVETVEVSVSSSPEGPWTVVGTAAGPTAITVP